MRRFSKKHVYVTFLLITLLGCLGGVWAQDAKESKGKAAPVGESYKKTQDHEPVTGNWAGTYKSPEGTTNSITAEFVQKDDKVTGSLTVDAGTLPIDKGLYNVKEKKLSFDVGPSPDERYLISGTIKGDAFAGEWRQGDKSGPFNLSRVKKSEAK